MATMNRNLNLEEVNSDAFMGIPFLNHQTIIQKIIFFGSIVGAVVVMLVGILAFQWNVNATMFASMIPLIIGVMFGCNYNQDLTLIQYLHLILFKPVRSFTTRPTEELDNFRSAAEKMEQEEKIKRQQEKQSSPAEQMRMIIILLVIVFVIFLFVIITIAVIKSRGNEEIHHTIAAVANMRIRGLWA